MQTFLPYADMQGSLEVLDYRRLGKQRVEAMQILNALETDNKWSDHTATRMWRGYEDALTLYMNLAIKLWIERGYNNTMRLRPCSKDPVMPPWWGHVEFHASHRARLLDKLPSHYRQFGWTELANPHGYLWPEVKLDGTVVWLDYRCGRPKRKRKRKAS